MRNLRINFITKKVCLKHDVGDINKNQFHFLLEEWYDQEISHVFGVLELLNGITSIDLSRDMMFIGKGIDFLVFKVID